MHKKSRYALLVLLISALLVSILYNFRTFLWVIENGITNGSILSLKISGTKKYKRNFLVTIKDQILPLAIDTIACFFLENSVVYCITAQKERYIIDQSLDNLITQLNPENRLYQLVNILTGN